MATVQRLADSHSFVSVPSKYLFLEPTKTSNLSSQVETVPVIDFSLLSSKDPHQTSQIVHDIGKACEEWGCFILVNHGVSKELREEMMKMSESFFNLPEEDKKVYAGTKVFEPIRWGTSSNLVINNVMFWRDFLRADVHPHFNAPHKPTGFSDTAKEYTTKCREIVWELLKAISKSLGLDEEYINKTVEMETGSQLFALNLYPPCPQPELAIGLPPHTDHGLLTLITQNDIGGLQVHHSGNWLPITFSPDALFVHTGDQLEILTNGIYKSVWHRAMVNNESTRISVISTQGPSLENVLVPAQDLVDRQNSVPGFRGISFKEYLEFKYSGKFNLDSLRI